MVKLTKLMQCFQKEATVSVSLHRQFVQTMTHHSQLLDILELPQLMDTCVRNRMYNEALDLLHFAYNLEIKHIRLDMLQQEVSSQQFGAVVSETLGKKSNSENYSRRGIDLIVSIVDAVHESAAILRVHFLQRLSGKVDLPECLETIDLLRRLYMLEEYTRNGTIKLLQEAEHLVANAGCSAPRLLSLQRFFKDKKYHATTPISFRLRTDFLGCRQEFLRNRLDMVIFY